MHFSCACIRPLLVFSGEERPCRRLEILEGCVGICSYRKNFSPQTMKFFVGRIDPAVSARELEDYFRRFGYIVDFKLFTRENYGFVTFEEPFNPDVLLARKEHFIGDRSFIVELSKSQGPRAERRDPYGDAPRDYERGEYRDAPRDAYWDRDSRRRDDYREPAPVRRRCEHCDRCPVHGVQPPREARGATTHLKLVCENVGQDVRAKDLEDFAIENGFKPLFAKTTRNECGLLEFGDMAVRDEALKKLDGAVLNLRDEDGQVKKSYTIRTRSFVSSNQFHRERSSKKRRLDEGASAPAEEVEDLRAREIYNDSEEQANGPSQVAVMSDNVEE